jgi:LytS/YehU family sensor histidine kinase
VPPLLLQPLVENALKHGLEPKLEGGEVKVSAREEGDRLVLEVADTGLGKANGATGGTGVGLANVRERLAAAYAGARLDAGMNPAGGYTVRLSIPR